MTYLDVFQFAQSGPNFASYLKEIFKKNVYLASFINKYFKYLSDKSHCSRLQLTTVDKKPLILALPFLWYYGISNYRGSSTFVNLSCIWKSKEIVKCAWNFKTVYITVLYLEWCINKRCNFYYSEKGRHLKVRFWYFTINFS